MNIALIGFMGTGKTSVGRRVAERLGYKFVDLDEVIVDLAGQEIPAIFAEQGEEYFRDLETKAVRQVVQTDKQVIATGGGVVLRSKNIKQLKAGGKVVLLKASPEAIYQRTKNDDHRPLLEVEDPRAEIRRLLDKRRSAYDCTPHQIDTTELTIEAVADKVIEIANR